MEPCIVEMEMEMELARIWDHGSSMKRFSAANSRPFLFLTFCYSLASLFCFCFWWRRPFPCSIFQCFLCRPNNLAMATTADSECVGASRASCKQLRLSNVAGTEMDGYLGTRMGSETAVKK